MPQFLARSKADKRYNDIAEKLRVARIYIAMLIATNDSNVQPWNAKPKKPNYLTPKSLSAAAGISRGSAFRLVTELRTYGGVVEKLGFQDDKAMQGRPTLFLPVVQQQQQQQQQDAENDDTDPTLQQLKDHNITTTIRGTLIPPAPLGAPTAKGKKNNNNASTNNSNTNVNTTQAVQITMVAVEALKRQELQTAREQLEQALQQVDQLQRQQAPQFAPPIPPPTRPPPTSQLGKRSLPTGNNNNTDDNNNDDTTNTTTNKDTLAARQYVRGSAVDDAQYQWKKLYARVMWTPQEDEALIQAFPLFGRNYQRIKEHAAPVLNRRSHIQLKDHVKLLISRGLLKDQPYQPGTGTTTANANNDGTTTTTTAAAGSNKRPKTNRDWEGEEEDDDDDDIDDDESTDDEQMASLLK